jgi:hypothetical protein
MKKTRAFVIVLVVSAVLSLVTVSLAAAGGYQQGGASDEISADQAGIFQEVTSGTGGGLACPMGTVETILYFSDFEADDGGWVGSGFGEWERGGITTGVHEFCDTTPRPEPSGPFSGANVWATNLDGCYQNSNASSFLTQTFDLSAISAPVQLSWWNWHEVFGTFDVSRVNVNATTLWEDTSSGATADWISETIDLSAYAGNAAVNVEYELDVTTVVNRSGWYLDDVAISYCQAQAPAIELTKTVGTDPGTCATTDNITVPAGGGGTNVYYCYLATNTGDVTLDLHTVVDDQLGTILGPNAAQVLTPTASYWFTASALITQTTVNSATWSATDASGGNAVSASDSATVTQGAPTDVSVSSFSSEPPAITPIWLVSLLLIIVGFGFALRRKLVSGQ